MTDRKSNQFIVEKRWARSTLQSEYLQGRRIHRFSPILTENIIITANAIDGMVAYERGSRRVLWRFDIKDGVEGGAQLVNGTIYFGAGDGRFYALQSASGKVLWTYPLKAEGLGRPLVSGDSVYVLGGNNVLHVLNAKTGKLEWTYNRREASNLSIRGGSQPAVSGDKVIVGFSDGALVALNRSSGALLWEVNLNRNKRFTDVDARPVIDGDVVYVSSYDGALYAVNVPDGKVIWMVEIGGYEEVLIVGSTLYYSSSDGRTVALDKSSGKILWQKPNPKGIATAPVLYKDALIVGEMEGDLRFLDVRTGEFLGQFAPGRGVNSKASIDDEKGEVYFMSHDANLFALKVEWRKYAKEWPWE